MWNQTYIMMVEFCAVQPVILKLKARFHILRCISETSAPSAVNVTYLQDGSHQRTIEGSHRRRAWPRGGKEEVTPDPWHSEERWSEGVKTYIKVWIWLTCEDPREKNITKWKSSKKGEISCCFGTFVREKKVRVADKHLCSECSKTFNSAFNLKRHMVSELHKQKPKKKKSRTTVMRKVRKFLSESDNLKEINRQRKNSDTSGLTDATLIEKIMDQIPQISTRNILKTLIILRKKLPKEAFQLSQNSVCHRLRALSEPLAFRILWHFG